MTQSQLLFLDATPGRSGRNAELERIRARKHAAVISHWTHKPQRKACTVEKTISSPPPQHAGELTLIMESPLCCSESSALKRSPSSRKSSSSSSSDGRKDANSSTGITSESDHTHWQNPSLGEEDLLSTDLSTALSVYESCQMADPVFPSDYSCFRGMRTDPFDFVPTDSSPFVGLAVDHFVQREAPNNAAVYKIFNVTSIYGQYMLELLQHDDYRACSVASTQSMMERLRNPDQSLSVTNLKNWEIAIQRLRSRLERRNGLADGPTIVTVLLFAASARTTRDFDAHEMHKRSLIPLIESCGGLDNLGFDGLAKCNIMQWDSFWALNHGDGATLFPEARRKSTPVYPEYPFDLDIAEQFAWLPSGFQRLVRAGRLSLDVIEVLSRTVDAENLQAERGYVVDTNECFKSGPRRYSDFWEACPCLGTANGPDERPGLEKLIILALILYCCNAFSSARVITVMYGGCRQRLTRDLLQWDLGGESDKEEDVRLWIWLNAIDSWRKADETLLPQAVELIEALKQRYHHITSVEQMWKKASRFFFNRQFEDRCRELWNAR